MCRLLPYLYVVIAFLSLPTMVDAQTWTYTSTHPHHGVDKTHDLIVVRIDTLTKISDLSTYGEAVLVLEDKTYTFSELPVRLSYDGHYTVVNDDQEYTLYFTQLPLIHITATGQIKDEPKIPANFTYSDEHEVITGVIGIEVRGGSSQGFPKKTYDLEFWTVTDDSDDLDVQFGRMRSDDDWILDGAYNEPLRIRSYISHRLWLDIHDPYYLSEEPEARAGADVIYTEVFLDGRYNGVYMLSEQIDRKLLQLKKFKDGVRGELYKGSNHGVANFYNLPGYNNNSERWDSYELRYPDSDDWIDWQPLYSFTDFIVNSSNSKFESEIWDRFNYDNYIDYFIYVNTLRLTDNLGKNIYLAKYNQDHPYYYVPWDLDGSIGLLWNGTNDPITTDILTNGMHDRVIGLNVNYYNRDVLDRWEVLRDGVLSDSSLYNRIQGAHDILKDNNIYHREAIVHGNYPFEQSQLDYMHNWMEDRLAYLDSYFQERTTSTTYAVDSNLSIYPNPTTDHLFISDAPQLVGTKYSILNVLGTALHAGVLNSSASISVSQFPAGMYYLQLESGVVKFVIE